MAASPDSGALRARILFWDIDGTLLTTARAGVFALEEAAREVTGTVPDFQTLETAGLTDSEVAGLALETVGCPVTPHLVSAFLRAYERHLPDRLHWREGTVLGGVRDVLDDLHTDPRVLSLLLTGNTAAGAEAKLRHYGLWDDFAAGAFCADGDDREAIAWRALDVAGDCLGRKVTGAEVLVVGDTVHDVRCAQAIGARMLGVTTGGGSARELLGAGADVVVERLPEPAEFRRLLGL